MKKRTLKLMAVAMVFALIFAFAALPASAATTYTPIGGSTNITKNLVVDADANIPDITFNYRIQRGTTIPATSSTVEILQADYNADIGTAAFTSADTAHTIAGLPTDAQGSTTAGSKYAQKSVTITFPSNSFPKPGVYRYVINETDGGKPGVSYDTTSRYLDVFVVADPDTDVLSVDSYVLRNSATTIGTDGEYTSDPNVKSDGYTNSVTQHDFEFSKSISGNQGDKNKRFTFTLNISNAIPGTYKVEATDVLTNPTTITILENGTGSAEYELTNGSSIKIVGLNDGAICTVSEDNEDYTASYSVNNAASVTGSAASPITLDNDYSVAFNNERDGIIPTGVLLTIAPFAIGLLLFGALAVFLIARKKKRTEDE